MVLYISTLDDLIISKIVEHTLEEKGRGALLHLSPLTYFTKLIYPFFPTVVEKVYTNLVAFTSGADTDPLVSCG